MYTYRDNYDIKQLSIQLSPVDAVRAVHPIDRSVDYEVALHRRSIKSRAGRTKRMLFFRRVAGSFGKFACPGEGGEGIHGVECEQRPTRNGPGIVPGSAPLQ